MPTQRDADQTSSALTGHLAGAADLVTTIADLANRATEPHDLADGLLGIVTPDGHRLHQIDLEDREPAPYRHRGTYEPATVDSLIAHVRRHFSEEHTTVWVHPENGSIVAIFNDAMSAENSAAAPPTVATGWRDHRSVLKLKHTPEWTYWMSLDGQLVSQIAFAEHMEDGVRELVEPAAADMLEMAQTFHAHQSASFRSANYLRDGTMKVQYDESIDATAGASGDMQIPTQFLLSIAPFLGEEPVGVSARLRYRLKAGVLTLGYKLDRPDLIIRQTLERVAGRLTDEFAHVFIGTPPAA